MNISGLKESRFLKRQDCNPPILVTITGCQQENMAKSGDPEELRWCLTFNEVEKPMVLNATNGQIIAAICGSEETDEWIGKKIVLYDDPNIQFQGRLVGGIRARAPKIKAAAAVQPKVAAKPAPAPVQEIDPGQEEEQTPF